MKTYLECIPCFTQQALDTLRMVTDDEVLRWRIMCRVLEAASRFSGDVPPPVMGAEIHRLIRGETGNPDPYAGIKRRANEFALELMPRLMEIVTASKKPFETALRLAIAGNIMDWGAKPHGDISEAAVERTLEDALHAPLEKGSSGMFYERLKGADNVLYLADNAGEIALDSLFIGFIPCPDITVAVKSGPVINDATMEDVRQVGLADRVEVIETGSDAPGTLLEECSEDFRERFASADVIIAKGQGNYETLSDRSEEIVFLLKAKCPVVARDIGCQVGDLVLVDGHRANVAAAATAGETEDAGI